MYENIKSKEDLQNLIINNYQDRFKVFLLEWCTGLGKSFGALRLIQKIKPIKVLLLVAEEAHKNNWIEEMNKYYSIYNYNIIQNTQLTIECYASLKKYENTEWDLVIFDECHHMSELRLSILSTMVVRKSICLSATLLEDQRSILLSTICKEIYPEDVYVSKVSLNKAIDLGLIPKPDIYLIPMVLNNTIYNQEIIETWGNKKDQVVIKCSFNEIWNYKKDKTKYPNVKLIISCTEAQKYGYYDDNITYFKALYMRTYQPYIYNKWMKLGNDRKKYLGSLKTEKLKYLVNLLRKEKKRFICFCSSIEQADEISNNKAIHSKNAEASKLIEEFQNKKRSELICVQMLTEGQNLTDIEVGIIAQLDGKELPFTQKHGRVLRSKNPLQFIFYFKDTRDEEYLNNILDNINKEYVQIIENLNEFILWQK